MEYSIENSIVVFSKDQCKNCVALKNLLIRHKKEFKEVNIFTPEALTELSMNGLFVRSAPVIQIGKKFYTTKDICIPGSEDLDQKRVLELLK